ncbi:MAG TPA: TAXI family TRAP transporter solute-binding subunit [Nitrospirota bacterium]|nr:TAXI family TRAP transporter solute-binding subunit [Nitrospirota bacterium]
MDSLDKRTRSRNIGDYFRARRVNLIIPVIAGLLIIVALLWVAIAALRPLPPRSVIMATGPEGGGFYEMGKRYQELLARDGIKLQLLSTGGAVENLARLRDPKSRVEVGLLQGGITNERESPDLESLGTVFYEPLWFFYRGAIRGRNLDVKFMQGKGLEFLKGRRISIGPEGSGTRAIALELLTRNGIDKSFAQLLSLPHREAGEKLLRGKIDAAFMMTSWDSPIVRRLISDERIDLVSFPRTDAYVALYPFLNKLTVPAGVGDLAKNLPPKDVILFAPKASLVVRKDLHPAIQYLLLDAAQQIHSGPGIFQKAGQFPAAESIDLPLSDNARQFYRSGRPFLQRHLPFWMAVMIDRLIILLIPLIGVFYPLLRFMPGLYAMEIRWRINRLYGELRSLEKDLENRAAGRNIGDLSEWLDRLEEKASRLRVPLFYANQVYTLRMHIRLVRERLGTLKEKPDLDL